MLKSLEIKDYALIENIKVEFGKGLNIITGETGAGKSILIGALSLLLGERASNEMIRKGANRSIVEGIFEISNNKRINEFLEHNEIEIQEDLILRREISIKGSNRCFINDTPVQLSSIKEVGNLLIDLHGQHDHQTLLRSENHIDLLDEFCNLEKDLQNYQTELKNLQTLISQKNNIEKNEENLKSNVELKTFQLKEISSVDPKPNEDEILGKELNILENSEKLYITANLIHSAIYEDENSVYDSLSELKNKIVEISKIDGSIKEKLDELNSALEQIKDIGNFMRDYMDKIDMDKNRLEEVRERLGAIYLLKKKYGGSIENVISLKEKIEEELNLVENFSERIENLKREINLIKNKLLKFSLTLSEKRKKEAIKVEKEIVKTLSYLGIADSKFQIKFYHDICNTGELFVNLNNYKVALNSNGFDKVEFFISTNIGEDLKPLSKIASGGEISRIMLAIKSVMAKTEKLPLLVFDEIDTGVSGRIAQKVGKVLKELGSGHQIISITHLPQIAAFADHHYSVEKQFKGDRTISSIKKLDENRKVEEIAKLLSGEKVTQINLDAAITLINNN